MGQLPPPEPPSRLRDLPHGSPLPNSSLVDSAWFSGSRNPLLPTTLAQPDFQVSNGVAQTCIPKEVLASSNPLWRSFAVGYFIGDAPHVGTIHATVNRLWTPQGRKSKINVQFIAENTMLFRIENDQLHSKVVKRHYWHISNIPLVVNDWNPETARNPTDFSAMPLWVDLKSVPSNLFSDTGLRFLGSITGNFVKLHPNIERCTRLDVACLLVEVNLHKPLIEHINFNDSGGQKVDVQVAYPWLPPRCSKCQKRGHLNKACQVKLNNNSDGMLIMQEIEMPPSMVTIPAQTVVSNLLSELSLITPVTDLKHMESTSVSDGNEEQSNGWQIHEQSNDWQIHGKKESISPVKVAASEGSTDIHVRKAHSSSSFEILGKKGDIEELE